MLCDFTSGVTVLSLANLVGAGRRGPCLLHPLLENY